MGSKTKILVENVSKVFTNSKGEEQPALREVNLEVREGEFLCLLGPSGCGKSTLLNLVAGFDQPSSGRVLIDGEVVTGPKPRYIAIFQNYGLFPWRTVLGNVEYGLEAKGVSRSRRREIAKEYIRLVGLEKFINSHPHELSGGMQQRVAIARALAVDPEVILMDEPFGALDAMTRLKMQEEIERIWQEKNKTIIFVTHDIEEAVYLADRIVVMTSHPGRIKSIIPVAIGRPRDRTSYDFFQVRDTIYKEFSLKRETSLDYYI
ncbi:ABC transporter ATP-binding protein [Calderihabitans maritimus]|uniref:ABC-type quaternary amine transporter n=1 Tax=Calderihabitans maritimus TaxID=1246530 RepID=A0A1Z5HWA3_9FIRM|nr:ABC transporter ATP-binding protein [Calderihabitans maritimus]GAW93688.1 ABC transporter [Calderihabitans maritimus]